MSDIYDKREALAAKKVADKKKEERILKGLKGMGESNRGPSRPSDEPVSWPSARGPLSS